MKVFKDKFKNKLHIMNNQLSKDDLLMKSLIEFYNDKKFINQFLNIVEGISPISLRILDWFVTNYAKKNNIRYSLTEENDDGLKKIEEFIVYLSYKSQLKAYSKKQFDPFCRRQRITFFYDFSQIAIFRLEC